MLPRIFNEITTSTWLMSPEFTQAQMLFVASLINGNQKNETDYSAERLRSQPRYINFSSEAIYQISEYGEAAPPEDAPQNSITILEIAGAITKNDQFCGPSGCKTKADLLLRADANPNVKAHILYIESGGGSGEAALEFSRIIKNEIKKPVFAFVEDLAASAAYWIAASCDYIYASNKFAQIGSIGTYISVADLTEYWAQQGIKWIDVYAKQSVDKNQDYIQAIEGNTALLEAKATEFNAAFISSVKSLRKGKINKTENPFTGKIYNADVAAEIGLIDEITTFNRAIRDIITHINK